MHALQNEDIQNYKDEDRKYLEKAGKLMRHKDGKIDKIEVQVHSENTTKQRTYQSVDLPQTTGKKRKVNVAL